MQQESDMPANHTIDAAARGVLDGAKDEPVPAKIIELAEELENVLAAKRKPAPKDDR
jgi:hypothetical protein